MKGVCQTLQFKSDDEMHFSSTVGTWYFTVFHYSLRPLTVDKSPPSFFHKDQVDICKTLVVVLGWVGKVN